MPMVHDSRDLRYRSPAGALPLGSEVTLRVTAPGAERCDLLLREDGGEVLHIPMTAEDSLFTVRIRAPGTPTLLWYAFEAEIGGSPVRCGAPEDGLGGEGRACPGELCWFQITVYRPSVTPEWYKSGIVYQIFPDRFARGTDWQTRWEDKCASPVRGNAKYVLSRDWDDVPFYTKRPDGTVTRWQFFGGTLSGIRENLGYLRSLGVTVLYLNPVFYAASNHRYDTADYLRIDPMLGDEQAFSDLCRAAGDAGIRIILDGVFNHTGSDSLYFNRFGSFPQPGAWQGPESRYWPWYEFRPAPEEYASWWGVKDLPSVREMDPGYLELICGKDGVIRKWLRLGAAGWRLDVADELPEEFIRSVREAALAEKPDALVLGEVWEDASNKVSYGVRRKYLLGDGLHSVMNYPFRSAALGFLTGEKTARDFCREMLSLKENYPPEAFYGALNLVGSHDRVRVHSILGGQRDPGTDDARALSVPAEEEKALARRRMPLLWAIQMAMPGVPCVYYGDEAGLFGFGDPFNRGTFPWGREDNGLAEILKRWIELRRRTPELVTGDFLPEARGDDVLVLRRRGPEKEVTVCVNRSGEERWVGLDGLETLAPMSWAVL